MKNSLGDSERIEVMTLAVEHCKRLDSGAKVASVYKDMIEAIETDQED